MFIRKEKYLAEPVKRTSVPETEGFMEVVAEKAEQDKNDFDEKAFALVGANAPEEVKKAWMDAAKEVNVVA